MASPAKNFFSILLAKRGIDPVRDVQWRQYPADLLGIALEKGEALTREKVEQLQERKLRRSHDPLDASRCARLSGC